MLRLHAVTAHHYKSFEPHARLELRPLTLLLGRNNAGKSSLLRLLPILARSASPSASATLDLSGPECKGNAHLRDYVWRRGEQLGFDLEWRDGTTVFHDRYTLRYADKVGAFIHDLSMLENGQHVFRVRGELNDDASAVTLRSADVAAPLRFRGIRPDEDPPHDALRALRKRLGGFGDTVQWLCANRVPPPRMIDTVSAQHFRLNADGSNAASILHSEHEPFKALSERVAAWYRHPEIGRSLRPQAFGDHQFRLSLDRLGQESQKIELLDTGEGMSQVLSVLVAAELARDAGPAAILAIEDPEDQLHENARAVLAEHLATRIASGEDAPRMVLETHSRTFLLGVQLAIARGALAKEHVAAYWIEQSEEGRSTATMVTFGDDGAPESHALEGLLSEDRKMARELLSLQLNAVR